jgi:hypothetical protein
MLGPEKGSERSVTWDPPMYRDATRFNMPAAGATNIQRKPVMGVTGQWTNARFSVVGLASEWADITFEIYAQIGGGEVLIHAATPREGNSRIEDGIIYSEVLSVQGYPCQGFNVYARPGAAAISELRASHFSLFAWGEEQPEEPRMLTSFNNDGDPIDSGGATPSQLVAPQLLEPLHMKQIVFHNIDQAATRYLFLFDRTTAAPLATQPEITPTRLLPDQQGSLLIPDRGHSFKNGLVIGVSSTDRTFTAAPAPDALLFTLWYRKP